ncbi:sugar nucleotide-binding protein [Lysobacter sp. H21R4]|uniref:sugar nucleotide-binding protein n=1 Tax=Lysobacter sp. H21R4 TaxID=2781021 RepID=UPI001888923E|nr:sugar nucleotide-binding protein [Lysobacter sp. H21R4]QOY62667.1 sugar nucleotide-binding protein [Lysobacter sp. H21R4]
MSEPLEAWGGIECTVNRVGSDYFSQLDGRAYASTPDDLDRLASTGIRALRFPVLWERVAPLAPDQRKWDWSDSRLARVRALEMRPIVGLLHHGSGPRYTSLVDPAFATQLARYACAVAQRYPWVEDYTPVNEPLTTARFSGLYGLWYPHGRDEVTFGKAMFNQCQGIVLAMRAIREINPRARLVQTEDLGTTFATDRLQYQADFHNHLRWLSWDLLCGRVGPQHPLHGWLVDVCHVPADAIGWFRHNPCPPDLIGINHYATSDRFLDEELARYPVAHHGGNGIDRYADVEAARAMGEPIGKIAPLIDETWKRYRIPVAITEAHIDAAREDQMRWLLGVWRGAEQARAAGADVRAVTAWGMLGSYDWNCLLTQKHGYYEVGAFDVSAGTPRPTAVATLIRQLADGTAIDHPVLSGSGWWKRPQRFLRDPHPSRVTIRAEASPTSAARSAPILIVGANGTLGRAFARLCQERDLDHRLLPRAGMDIADSDSVSRALDLHRPWTVVNAAGYVRVDDAEADAERCFRENTLGPSVLAKLCARHAIPMVTFSSDLVFDGTQDVPYLESDPVSPISVYGRSKARSEAAVLETHSGALVIRTSAFFGPWDEYNFVSLALRALRAGSRFTAAEDMVISPTYVPDLVDACLDLLIDGETGIWHLTNGEAVSWAELARRAAHVAGVDIAGLKACDRQRLALPAARPRYSVLGSERMFAMPSLDSALLRFSAASTGTSGQGRQRDRC